MRSQERIETDALAGKKSESSVSPNVETVIGPSMHLDLDLALPFVDIVAEENTLVVEPRKFKSLPLSL